MKRKLYNYCTLASLVLLCATLWGWHHTAQRTDQLTLHGLGGASMQLTGSGGQVMLTKATNSSSGGGHLSWSSNADAGSPKLLATTFSFNGDANSGMTLVVPTWALALVFVICPSLWVWSKVRKDPKKKKKEAH